jgi:hypothetical protein
MFRLELLMFTPGMSVAKLANPRPVRMVSSRLTTLIWLTFWISTMGLLPSTVIVSSTVPMRISAFTVAVKPTVSSMPSRRTVEKLGS